MQNHEENISLYLQGSVLSEVEYDLQCNPRTFVSNEAIIVGFVNHLVVDA